MPDFLIHARGLPLSEVQATLDRLLPGIDSRLFAIDARRAVLRGHLLDALDVRYEAPAAGWLSYLGAGQAQPLVEGEALALMRTRDRDRAPELGGQAVPSIAGLDWHLDCVRARQAWSLLGGPDGIDWGNTRIAQIDTGYVPHAAFGFGSPGGSWIDVAQARTDMPPGFGDNPNRPPEPGGGIDPLNGSFNSGHGSRIGATISGHAPTAPGGAFYGAAPRVPHLPLRITDAVVINHAQRQFAKALDYAVDQGAGALNCSLGMALATYFPEIKQAVNRAYDAGVILVCAAGNYIDPVVAPARWSRTVAVGGVVSGDGPDKETPWSGSSFGPEVDFSAPAADLRRAEPSTGAYARDGKGTSYATGLTTGAAALWLAHRRGAIEAAYGNERWKIPEAFRVLARSTARKPHGWQAGSHGDGVLDIEALLLAALPTQLTRAPQV